MEALSSMRRDRRLAPRPSAWTVRCVFAAGTVVHQPPHAVAARDVILGCAPPGRGWALPEAAASPRHARLWVEAEALWLEALDRTARTAVGGRSTTRRPLHDGAVLRLGDCLFVVRQQELGDPPCPPQGALAGLTGEAPAVRALRRAVDELAPLDRPVVVLGERGTGRRTTARALHLASGRQGPLLHLQGGEAAAIEGQPLGPARGGTLFVDGVDAAPAEPLARLLRGAADRDLRVVLAGEAAPGLAEALDAAVLRLPPLRARTEDVLTLVERCRPVEARPPTVDEAERLLLYPWPGNLPELEAAAGTLSPGSPG